MNQEQNVLGSMESKVDNILTTLQEIKEGKVEKVYNTKELCDYLKVGKSVIEKLRQSGDLSYVRVGKSYIYTQSDIEDYFENNRVKYVV